MNITYILFCTTYEISPVEIKGIQRIRPLKFLENWVEVALTPLTLQDRLEKDFNIVGLDTNTFTVFSDNLVGEYDDKVIHVRVVKSNQ